MTPPPPAEAAPSTAERLARLRLARTRRIGIATFTKYMGLYGTAEQAIEAIPARARLSGREAPPIPSASQMEDEIAWLAQRGACHLLRSDAAYPRLLATLPNAPILLYAQGNTALLSAPSLAIVGARKASSPALTLTEQFAAGLAEAGLTIISGLARGIDGAAHRGALPFGRTIAALPGGLDVTYPPEHAKLQAEIARQGCLLSEYAPGTIANARHFPRRNHLIAGLAQGCLLVEAARRSGTLITARLALEYQRLLFAIPGFPKDPRSSGGNDLLRQNKARLVETFQDILTVLEATPQPDHNPAPWHRPASRQPSLFAPSASILSPMPGQDDTDQGRSKTPTPQPFSSPGKAQPAAPTPIPSRPKEAAPATKPITKPATQPGNPADKTAPRPPCNPAPQDSAGQSPTSPQSSLHPANQAAKPAKTASPSALEDKKNVLSLLAHTPCTVDEIASRCQLSISAVAAILIELEITGAIQRHGDGSITTL